MTDRRSSTEKAARAAALCAAGLIAQQVGFKATRDALFLSHFEVTALPTMVMVSGLASLAFVLLTTRLMTAVGPGRLLPIAFVVSGALQLIEWRLAKSLPGPGAVVVYLHVGAFGSLLVSTFWLLVSERFDPRTARRAIGRIAGAGTLGGLLGGLLAERAAASAGVAGTIPFLAGVHFLVAAGVRSIGSGERPRKGIDIDSHRGSAGAAQSRSPLQTVLREGYLRTIAGLVIIGSVGAAILDYLFKATAAAASPDAQSLVRLFAAFYAGCGLLTFLVQTLAARVTLERLGLARTVASMPLALLVAGVGAWLAPGLLVIGGLRGAETVLRGSLYRIGYELLYNPVPRRRKRAGKALIDVGLERVGDVAGGGFVRLVLGVVPHAGSVLGAAVAVLGLAGLAVARGLHRAYVRALEQSLLSREVELDALHLADRTTRSTVLLTVGALPAEGGAGFLEPTIVMGAADPMETVLPVPAESRQAEPEGAPGAAPPRGPALPDRLVHRLSDLRSGDAGRARQALGEGDPLRGPLVAQTVGLLAWDEVWPEAIQALRGIAPRIVGQLVDSLLDPDEEFAIRRRIPRVLSVVVCPRAVDGLLEGLADRRFEVRRECGRALAAIKERGPGLRIDADRVLSAVQRELAVEKGVWDARRLLEAPEATDELLGEGVLRVPGSVSLGHVFTLLSLVRPRDPLRVAFRALHSDEEGLRGLALEYLQSALPAPVSESLFGFLEGGGRAPAAPRPPEEIVERLMLSSASIELNLAARRRRTQGDSPS